MDGARWLAERRKISRKTGDTIDGGDTINGSLNLWFGHTFFDKNFKIHEFIQINKLKNLVQIYFYKNERKFSDPEKKKWKTKWEFFLPIFFKFKSPKIVSFFAPTETGAIIDGGDTIECGE